MNKLASQHLFGLRDNRFHFSLWQGHGCNVIFCYSQLPICIFDCKCFIKFLLISIMPWLVISQQHYFYIVLFIVYLSILSFVSEWLFRCVPERGRKYHIIALLSLSCQRSNVIISQYFCDSSAWDFMLVTPLP